MQEGEPRALQSQLAEAELKSTELAAKLKQLQHKSSTVERQRRESSAELSRKLREDSRLEVQAAAHRSVVTKRVLELHRVPHTESRSAASTPVADPMRQSNTEEILPYQRQWPRSAGPSSAGCAVSSPGPCQVSSPTLQAPTATLAGALIDRTVSSAADLEAFRLLQTLEGKISCLNQYPVLSPAGMGGVGAMGSCVGGDVGSGVGGSVGGGRATSTTTGASVALGHTTAGPLQDAIRQAATEAVSKAAGEEAARKIAAESAARVADEAVQKALVDRLSRHQDRPAMERRLSEAEACVHAQKRRVAELEKIVADTGAKETTADLAQKLLEQQAQLQVAEAARMECAHHTRQLEQKLVQMEERARHAGAANLAMENELFELKSVLYKAEVDKGVHQQTVNDLQLKLSEQELAMQQLGQSADAKEREMAQQLAEQDRHLWQLQAATEQSQQELAELQRQLVEAQAVGAAERARADELQGKLGDLQDRSSAADAKMQADLLTVKGQLHESTVAKDNMKHQLVELGRNLKLADENSARSAEMELSQLQILYQPERWQMGAKQSRRLGGTRRWEMASKASVDSACSRGVDAVCTSHMDYMAELDQSHGSDHTDILNTGVVHAQLLKRHQKLQDELQVKQASARPACQSVTQ